MYHLSKNLWHPGFYLTLNSIIVFVSATQLKATPLQEPLDQLSEHLFFEAFDGLFQTQLGGSVDLEGYYFPNGPIGFILTDNNDYTHLRPRLTLTADTFLGERLYSFVKFRWDDGFDPNYEKSKVRFDEYFFRLETIPGHLHIQLGKFATIFGNWAGRHDPWENPFITSPLPYDEVTSALDGGVWPNVNALANAPNVANNIKTWVPVIWGPAYTKGAALFANYEGWDLALSIKNRALSSRPSEWDDPTWSDPTWTGRLGYALEPAWRFGLSGSLGPYIRPFVASNLPGNNTVDDYDQTTLGADLAYSQGKWQLWAEFIYSNFEIPNGDKAGSYSYYIETKYKLSHRFFVAGRWAQQFYDTIDTPAGDRDWDNDLFRIEASAGYRFDHHIQLKLQYTFQHQDASFQNGDQLLVSQLTLRF